MATEDTLNALLARLRAMRQAPIVQRLHHAAQYGTVAELEATLAAGADVNAGDEDTMTPLMLACMANKFENVRCLLAAGAAVDLRNKVGGAALHVAAHFADTRTVALLLAHGADVLDDVKDGTLALHIAAYHKQTDVVELLLESHSPVDATDGNGYTALHWAAELGDVPTMTRLVAHGSDIEATSKTGRTPLYISALKGKESSVQYLLDNGASVGAVEENGCSATHAAAEFGSASILDDLVQQGGDVQATTNDGTHPLHYAASTGSVEVIDYLLNHGASIEAISAAGVTPLLVAAEEGKVLAMAQLANRGADVHKTTKFGRTALHLSARKGKVDAVRYLLDKGVAVDALDNDGWTALHAACFLGGVPIMALLVDHGADVHKLIKNGSTTLYMSAQEDNAAAVQFLLDHRVAVDAMNDDGFQALHNAAANGALRTMALLVERGSNVRATSKALMQPIHCAAWSGQSAAIRFLLDHGSEVEPVDSEGWTPLHKASHKGDVSTIALLVERGADVHNVTKDGRTALYVSIEQAKLEAVKYLLEAGAAVDVFEEDGWSPLHAAAKVGDVPIMTLLMERGADMQRASKIGELPVHIAASHGNTEAAKYLLDRGAPADATYDDGSSVLHLAANIGDVRTMALLIEHGADVQAVTKVGRSTLHESAWEGKAEAVRFLIERGVALEATDEKGWSVLHFAADSGDLETIKLLVGLGSNTHALTKDKHTTLLFAAWKGNLEAVMYLLECGVSQSADTYGWTPLYAAADVGDVRTMQYLVEHGADVQCTAKSGHNILHQAVYRGRVSALSYIVDLTVDVNAIAEVKKHSGTDNDGNWETAMMLAVWHPDLETASEMAYLLCSRGAEWPGEHRRQALITSKVRDEAEGVSAAEHERRHKQREGLCVCVHHWSQEQLTTRVPIEVIARGAASVETYLADVATSGAKGITNRSKSCVVGPSEWGKTSLVRTLVAKKLSLTQLKDRTVGIDLALCLFTDQERGSDDVTTAQLEVTFWDFAGQTVYHVAHGPFFSRRTLYIVAVDVEAYSKKLKDAQAKPLKDREIVMNRFVSTHMWRWIGMILAYQPDARFVFVGTKADCVEDESLIQKVRDDVQDRLETWERKRADIRSDGQLKLTRSETTQTRLSSSFQWVSLNGKAPESIVAARQFMQQTILSLDIGFPMGSMYSQVLRSVKVKREDSRSALNGTGRIEKSIVLFTTLRRELMLDINGLKYAECEQILRTFHDLGDILWYEHDDAGVLKDFVILDPMLVIDVVREVIRHDFDAKTGVEWPYDGRIAHKFLYTFALWKDMDKELMYAFKKLLQHFQLAYPVDDDVMQPESDLIVPTYWKVHRAKSSRSLLTRKSVCDIYGEHRWCWEYEVSNELVEIIFDQFAVQSHAAHLTRVIRGACIEAQCNEFATSIKLIQQNANSDVIRIEVSGTTMERTWHTMRFYLMKMEKVLDGYNGVTVGRYIIHRPSPKSKEDVRHPLGPVASAVKTAIELGENESVVRARMPWMPPDLLWYLDKSWTKDIRQFQTIQMQSVIEAKLEVLRNLTIAGSAPRFPALWSLERLSDDNKVVVRVMSDLSGVCYHVPMEIVTGSPWLTRYGTYFKAGISIVSTVLTEALTVPLVNKALGAIKTNLDNHVDHVYQIHNLIERLDIKSASSVPPATVPTAAAPVSSVPPITTPSAAVPASIPNLVFESRTAKLPPDVAKAVLLELLTIYNDSSDELNVSQLTNLECVVTAKGEYVWAHEHEIGLLGDKITRRGAPPSVWNDLPEPAPAPPSSPSPKASGSLSPTNQSQSSGSSISKLKLSLCVPSVTGLTDWDWYKTYCTWQLFYGASSTVPIASGATVQNTDTTVSPSWASSKTFIESVSSVEMLRECRLVIQVKRRSRIGWTKLIGEGQVLLGDELNVSASQTWKSDVIQVPLEDASPAKRSVEIQLAREV